MGPEHPESPARLQALEERLWVAGLDVALTRCDAPLAVLNDVLLAHSAAHVQMLQAHASALSVAAVAPGGVDLPAGCVALDEDTRMNAHTWQAALRGAGAAVEATVQVLAGQLDNAFCAIRPPGHHAGRNQAMGFCFINPVAIAAKYAVERGGLKRVAIVDFDVHHGNGTEDIVAGDARVCMVGLYQHPFFPSGGSTSGAANVFNVPVAAYTKGMEVRELVQSEWLPRLNAFKPEMIFISAGFDGHRLDDMGQLGLNEQDYAWITSAIKDVALRHAKGRIVSCLEGGYHLQALASSVEAHLRVLADV